ncbi:hypothetical protein ACO0LF_22860 [Undibacterium sp. Di27W]|uniref:hypothetical protein n=1 Tax=Undibacterium sp. Di27W TaxID=3413036 RepID=UPI003BF32027
MRTKRLLSSFALFIALANLSANSSATSNDSLRAMYEADQNERKAEQVDFSRIINNDSERRAAVLNLLQTSKLNSAEDYFHAAMIYQHGTTLEDIRMAYSLSNIAVILRPDHQHYQRLRALAWDRMMLQLNKPQWYGSQSMQQGADQDWKLYDIDETAVSDHERKALGMPTLAEAKSEIARLNAELQKQRSSTSEKPKEVKVVKPVLISFQRDPGTGYELLAIDRCLAMFWIKLSERGMTEALSAQQASRKTRLFVLRKEEKDVLALLDGRARLILNDTSSEACFFDYVAYVDENRHLILDLALDDKVVAGPGTTFDVKPYKYFRIKLEQLDTDLKGRQIKLLQAEKIVLTDMRQ